MKDFTMWISESEDYWKDDADSDEARVAEKLASSLPHLKVVYIELLKSKHGPIHVTNISLSDTFENNVDWDDYAAGLNKDDSCVVIGVCSTVATNMLCLISQDADSKIIYNLIEKEDVMFGEKEVDTLGDAINWFNLSIIVKPGMTSEVVQEIMDSLNKGDRPTVKEAITNLIKKGMETSDYDDTRFKKLGIDAKKIKKDHRGSITGRKFGI